MIDRHGSPVRVGWLEHEILWLEAAMSLPCLQRTAAYRDIAELTGRPESAVRYKAGALRAAQDRALASRVLVPERHSRPRPLHVVRALPSALAAPSKAQLTGGNARVSRRRPNLEAAE